MTRAYFLFARPSALEGAARLFDFANALGTYNYSPSEQDADARGLREDWRAVGEDLAAAMDSFAVSEEIALPNAS